MEFSRELSKDLKTHITESKALVKTLVKRKEELQENMESELLKEHLELFEQYALHMSKASIFSQALFEVHQDDEQLNQDMQTVQRAGVEFSEQLLYFGLTLKTFSEETLHAFANQLPRYNNFLRQIAKKARYALSEEQEQLINRKDTSGIDTVEKLYGMITSKYVHTLEVQGEELELTRSELVPYMIGDNRELRKKARDALIQPYTEDRAILAEIYGALVTDYDYENQLRGYENPIHSRHLANDINESIYQALLTSAKKHQHLFVEYVDIKKQLLGYENMYAYDMRATIQGLPEGLGYEESKQRVQEVFTQYADWLSDGAKKMFANNRIDVHPRKNKRGGACCIGGLPDELPLLVLNHTKTYESLKTLAHEMGHAVHSILAQKNTIFDVQSQIVLAESASNLAETLMFEDALSRADKQTKIALLCDFLDDCIASIPTQIKYTQFEQWAHGEIQQGATPTEISTKWRDMTKNDFPNIKLPEEESNGWLAIPHIYEMPFYCYGYSFGILVALSLYEQTSPEHIKEILSAGGSREPAELLLEHGLNIESEAFWDAGFAKISERLTELKQLV